MRLNTTENKTMANNGTKWMCVRAKDGAILRKSGNWCWVGPANEIKLYNSARAASRYGISRITEEDYAEDRGGLREVGKVVPVEPGQYVTMNGTVGRTEAWMEEWTGPKSLHHIGEVCFQCVSK